MDYFGINGLYREPSSFLHYREQDGIADSTDEEDVASSPVFRSCPNLSPESPDLGSCPNLSPIAPESPLFGKGPQRAVNDAVVAARKRNAPTLTPLGPTDPLVEPPTFLLDSPVLGKRARLEHVNGEKQEEKDEVSHVFPSGLHHLVEYSAAFQSKQHNPLRTNNGGTWKIPN